MTRFHTLLLFMLFCAYSFAANAQKIRESFNIHINVKEKDTSEPVIMANCQILPLASYASTDANGHATINNVPTGTYTVKVTYIGFKEYQTTIKIDKELNLNISLTPTSLALKEIVVTAKPSVAGASTASIIGRQAIDHLQASSLADIMQLIPGQQMGNNNLMSTTPLQLRALTYNNTNALGSSIVVDGMPISNNGLMTQGTYSSASVVGTDLRSIAADNIESVEVIRGIPSAEYGDLTSGLVVVNSKTGVTPWQVKAKINPTIQNYSLGKGFNLKKAGILNFNFDYAKAWGDPRLKSRSYGRYSFGLGYGYDINKKWHTETRLRVLYSKDFNGSDPDAIAANTFNNNKNYSVTLSQSGRISLNLPLARTLNYTAGFNLSGVKTENSSYVRASGNGSILNARETGYYRVNYLTSSYYATGYTESLPGNTFFKLSDSFYHKWKNTRHSFKVGTEYSYTWNSGKGYYNGNDSLPYRPNSDGRPRAFSEVPGIHQVSAYAEDAFTWNINKTNRLRAQFGLRFTALQPFANVATTSLSPRLNLGFTLTRWLDIRAGIGMNSKTPVLAYLYPDKKYTDRLSAVYTPQNDPAAQLMYYYTNVYNVEYSRDLKNATTTRIEAGLDFKLPWGSKLSVLGYYDRTPNGFSALTDYTTYTYNRYNETNGLIITPGSATQIDPTNPAMTITQLMTTGRIGNTSNTLNRGIEFDFDFGEIKLIKTTIQYSGAYSENKAWDTDLNTTSPRSALLNSTYQSYGLSPFAVIYPSGQDYTKYRQFLNTLRIVTHIPTLKLVASFTAQAIFYNYSHSYTANKTAIGWISISDLAQHRITDDMRGGYIGYDGNYYATQPTGIDAIRISDLNITYSDNVPTRSPITWNLQGRLTKQLGRFGGLSLYVNNLLYYEPYLSSNTSSTLTQRNTGTFGYGVELYINL